MTKEQFLDYSLHTGLNIMYIGSDGCFKGDVTKDDYNMILMLTGIGKEYLCNDYLGNGDDIPLALNQIKPILHPLSDLTKPITHKGETFVPMLRLAQIKVSKGLFEDKGPTIDFKCKIVEKPFGKLAKCTKLDEWVVMISLSEPERADFWIIQTLIEWRFDIAGLIEKGEAIDVNTLETNPYA